MEVLTLTVRRKTSTCSTLPSPRPASPPSAASMSSALKPSANDSHRIGRSSSARVVEADPWCRKCGAEGVVRDTIVRRLAHEPFGHRPTTLLVRVRRYRCDTCGRTWREDTTRAGPPRSKISRGGLDWALTGIVVDHLTVTPNCGRKDDPLFTAR